jgi:hypothetical protein
MCFILSVAFASVLSRFYKKGGLSQQPVVSYGSTAACSALSIRVYAHYQQGNGFDVVHTMDSPFMGEEENDLRTSFKYYFDKISKEIQHRGVV